MIVVGVTMERIGNELSRGVKNVDVLRVSSDNAGEQDRTASGNVGYGVGDVFRTRVDSPADHS